MTDLLYFGYAWKDDSKELENKFKSEINSEFSDVKLTDAFDDIKGYRQEVSLPEEQKDDYLAWVFAFGWLNCSMNVQLSVMTQKGEAERILELAKQKYPGRIKKECV